MLKEFFIVSIGSFFGGGMRFLVSGALRAVSIVPFPLGTFAVNVLGCLIFGFVSGLSLTSGEGGRGVSATTKLLLTTGSCGGFTTFSTFMKESSTLMKEDNFVYLALYVVSGLVVGFLAMIGGHEAAKML